MKKRVLSMLLAFILCFSTLPMTAFAQKAVQEADVVTEQAGPAAEQKEAEAAAAPGAETPADKSIPAGDESISDNNAGTQDTGADDEKKAAVQKVQALIDALPETVTEDNAESVSAQLEAIAEAMESLTEEQIAELDMEHLYAISEAMSAPMTVAEQHTHCICGKEHHGIGDHKADSQVTFTKLWMDNDTLKMGDTELTATTITDKNSIRQGKMCYVLPAGNYYLGTDIKLGYPIYIASNGASSECPYSMDVKLCLNGKTLTANGDFDAIVCSSVVSKTTFTLTDCQQTAGTITHAANKTGSGVLLYSNGNGTRFNMYGGSLTHNTAERGGGVNIVANGDGGIFNLYGGVISDNEANDAGGGVYIDGRNATFTMYGGEITNNTAGTDGGGVSAASAKTVMNGGSITGNTAAKGGGASVGCHSSAYFYMNGGEIKNNKASENGGGVYVYWSYSYLHLSGEVNINGNTSTDSKADNVYLSKDTTIIIDNNLATDSLIGVTTEKIPQNGDFTKVAVGTTNYSLTEADRQCFTSDAGGQYVLEKLGDHVILKNSNDTTLHHHPICGKICSHGKGDSIEHTDVYWEGVSTLNDRMPAGYYYLTGDVTLNTSWTPQGDIVLDLNGHNITMNGEGCVINQGYSGTFTLTDCKGNADKYGKVTHGNNIVGGGIYNTSSMSDSNFVMYGGSITGNTGHGVFLQYKQSSNRSFTMYGGEITGNTTTSGGGVYVGCGNTFTMKGGIITGNKAEQNGGGVYVAVNDDKWKTPGVFNVSGDAQITGNYKTDDSTADNVYLQSDTNGRHACINVDGALSGNASIGVSAGTIDVSSYKIVAQGSNYTLTKDDLNHFNSDVAGYTSQLVDNSIAFTNGTLHEHKICGKTDCNEGHSNALWIPLTYNADTATLKYGTTEAGRETTTKPTEHYIYTLPAGNYYLAQDITLEGSINISGNVNICLDGHTISTNKYCHGVFYFADYKLTVCDCENKGKILVANTGEMKSVAVNIRNSSASFDLYGGTISGGYSGVYTNGPVGLYGGTIEGNKQGVTLYKTTLTIGGDAKVIGNTDENVMLQDTQTITIANSLTEHARIGITTSTEPTEDKSIRFATGETNTNLDYSKIFIPDVKNQNYVVSKGEDGNLYLGIHQHSWKVAANANVITFTCSADGCDLGENFATTYTVKAPADLTYSGSEKVATVEAGENAAGLTTLPKVPDITYQKYNGTEYISIEGAPKDAGTYRATLEITNSDNTTATATLDYAITKAPLTVTAKDKEITYGDNPANDGVVYSGFVNGEDEKVLSGMLGYTYSYEQYDNVGDAYTITPAGLTSDNYDITYVPGTLKVNQLEAKLAWENTADRTYGDRKGNVTAKVTNLVNNDVIDVTVSGGDTLTAGTHTATATGLTGDKADNYTLPANVTREYEIGFMAQKLTFATSGDVTKTYGDDAFANAATNDRADGSKVTYSSSDPFVAEVNADGKVTIKGAGTAIITASAQKVEGKYSVGNAEYTLIVNRKELTAEDLEFTTDALITKKYDGTIDCTTATVKMKDSAIVNADDMVPTVTGTYAYNSANVNDAKTVTFTSKETITRNYILPAGLTVKHAASISKADQAPITITSTSATYGTDLTLTVDGGSGNGALTYTVENGTGAATISGSTLRPVRAGQVTVTVKKSGGDNYNDVTSSVTITINKGTYTGTVGKTVNIIKNRSTAQTGTLKAADFFQGKPVPDGAVISDTEGGVDSDVVAKMVLNATAGEFSYTSAANITSTTDQTCTVTISSTNYKDITATLTFHPTDRATVTIDGLTYTDKTYDGKAMEPEGTLKVSGDKVPVSELEVKYEGTGNTAYNSTTAPKDAGTYQVTYKVGENNENYTGEVTYTFTISQKNVTKDMIGAIAAQEYTGSAITPELVVKDGGVALILGTDFDLKYDNNTNAGTATLTITGKGNYKGTADKTFTIEKKDIAGAVIKLEQSELCYNGSTQTVKIESVTVGGKTLASGDYSIVNGSDMFMSAKDSIPLTIEGRGNYTGTATTTWKITKIDPVLDNFVVTSDLSTAQTYDGTPKAVTVQTKDVIGMGAVKVYYEGTDGTTYTRSETAPTNAGSYKVILNVAEGTNYKAATDLTKDDWVFTIQPATLTVTPTAGQSKTYGDRDPVAFSYEVSGEKFNDKPVFTGTLGRAEGKNAGTYAITLGTLALKDGANFLAKNYKLVLDETTVNFTIDPKILYSTDLQPLGSTVTKVYDGTTKVNELNVVVDSDSMAADDAEIKVTGTAVYNSANVADAKSVIFTPDAITTGNYRLAATEQLEVSGMLSVAITPATITVTPNAGQTKIYGEKDNLTYTYTGAISGETPLFTGALGREADENVGSYVINKGTLALMDNSDGNFSAGNYTLKLSDAPVNFVITKATPEITVGDKTLVKNGVAVDISTWASFNNTDAGAKLTYTLVGAPVGISLTGDNLLMAENAATTAQSFNIKVTADATANFTAPEQKQFTVQVVEKADAGVKIDAPTNKTYGDADFTLQASTVAADNGTWSWTSSNESILKIVSGAETAAPVIHVVKADATGATLTATYISDAYYGTASVKITVAPKNVTGAMIGVIDSKEYNGGAIQPTPEVKDGETILAPGRDFKFSYSDNTNAGTATLTITGKGNYTGIAEKKFTIEPKNIESAIIVLGGLNRPYTGEEQTVEIVSVTLPDGDGVNLERDIDYTVKDNSNTATDAAEIVLTIEGRGNYTGTAAKIWTITRIEPTLADFDVVPDLSNELTYSGEEQIVNVTTKAGIRGMGMITVRYNGSTEKPVNAGSYAITIDVADGSNYKKISGIEAGTLTIKKAAAPTLADVKVDHAYATTGNQTVSLAELVKSAKSYAPGEITGNAETEILSDINVTGDGVLQYTLTGKGAAGSTVTIPVTITSTNYEETTVNVVITIKQATPTGTPGYDFVHDSSKTLKDAGLDLINSTLNPKEGTLEWIDSNGKVLPGETKLEEGRKYIWRFTPDNPNYAVITGEVELYAPYRILDGADSTWTQSTDGTIAIRGNGDFEKFQSVKVDGVVVDAKNYTVAKGSTIITFKEDYLKTLSTGSHTFELVWTDGSAATKFTIAAKPDNGDNNNSDNNNNDKNDDSDNDTVVIGNVSSGNNSVPAVIGAPKTGDASGIWMTLFAVSLAGLAAMLVRKKNNRE